MKIGQLKLINFRNYKQKSFEFDSHVSLLIGGNGVGKTNVLEAIYLLSRGESFRATREEQMIFYREEIGRVSAPRTRGKEDELEIVLTKGEVQGEKVPKKKYLINGTSKRKMDFVGNLKCVLFRPEDIELVLGSPSIRRDYLNQVLEQKDREYRRAILSYKKGLRSRNKVLEKIREGEAQRQQLLFWDKLLLKNGEIVSQKREEFLEFVNQVLEENQMELKLFYDRSVMSEKRLKQYARQEVAAGNTLVGPHRDDFSVIKKREGKAEKDLSIYGSRGEQRMAVLGMKLSELEFLSQEEERPILLLDDIFSELDSDHRDEVLKLLPKQQTIITSTEEEMLPLKQRKKIKVIKL